MINGNMVGGTAPIKTVQLVDKNGNEVLGVVVDQETIFTAGDNDVREGFVYASDKGVSTGTKIIPAYYARCGKKIVSAGSEVTIAIPEYEYDNLMVVIVSYNTSLSNSVISTHVSIDDTMYEAGGGTKISDITIDKKNEQINLGITVSKKSVLRYFVIKEEY